MASSVNGKQRVPILFTLTTCSNGRLLIRPSHHRSRSAAPPRLPASFLSKSVSPPSPPSLSRLVLWLRSPTLFSPASSSLYAAADSHSSSLPRPSSSSSSLLHHIANLSSSSGLPHRQPRCYARPPPSFPPSIPLGLIRDPDSTSGIDVCRM
jgi:hypothetical protein